MMMRTCVFFLLIQASVSNMNVAYEDPLDISKLALISQEFDALLSRAPTLFSPSFGNHMVLKADGAVIFGSTHAGEEVFVTVKDAKNASIVSSVTVTASTTGYWTAQINIPASLASYNITVNTTTSNGELVDVLFGDVYLCSGQSNMDFCLGGLGKCRGGAFSANETVAAASNYPEIRLKHNGWRPSFDVADPNQKFLREFSAVCYLTAVAMKKILPDTHSHLPIGLVQASVGGTMIEMWSPPSVMQSCGLPNSTAGSPTACGKQFNSKLYEQYIQPLEPMAISAVFWYQGESNSACDGPKSPYAGYYGCLLPNMVDAWRKSFNQIFPFLVVQLAAYGPSESTSPDRSNSDVVEVRKDQLQVMSLPKTGVALAIDLGDDGKLPYTPPTSRHGGIHPRNKTEVGRRLALSYANILVGEERLEGDSNGGSTTRKIVAEGPFPTKAIIQDTNHIRIVFDHNSSEGMAFVGSAQCHSHGHLKPIDECCPVQTAGSWRSSSMPFAGMPFEVRFVNGTYAIVHATVTADHGGPGIDIVVTSATNVITVRYCSQDYPLCVLRNPQGLPATPFNINITTDDHFI